MMQIRQFFDLQSSTYSYLLWDTDTGEAALIDSVKEQVERDTQMIRELELDLRYLLETHIHADHITGAGELRKRFDAKVLVHKNSGSQCADQLLGDKDTIMLGKEKIQVLYTPGHTNTDISYLIDGAVFTGDTLLIRGSGRTDFQSGNASEAYDSIMNKLFTLSDLTIIYPGHDYEGRTVSSIGEEKKYNPRLGNGKTREEYIKIMDNMDLPKPKMIEKAVPGNMECGLP